LLAACQSVGAGAAPAARLDQGIGEPSGQPGAMFQRIKGAWSYAQSCGWQHSASLDFMTESEGIVHGDWADGTQVRGESGKFIGTWRGDKLFLRFCRIDVYDDDPEACPNYSVERAYATRRGQKVFWYRNGGSAGYWKYLELHPFVEGGSNPVDDDCSEGD
jgi:hypothetical protein